MGLPFFFTRVHRGISVSSFCLESIYPKGALHQLKSINKYIVYNISDKSFTVVFFSYIAVEIWT